MVQRGGDPDKAHQKVRRESVATILQTPALELVHQAIKHVQVQQSVKAGEGKEPHVLQERKLQTGPNVFIVITKRKPAQNKTQRQAQRHRTKHRRKSIGT